MSRAAKLAASNAIDTDSLAQAKKDMATAEAQVVIKEAEVFEAEVRLRQARRRLVNLQQPSNRSRDRIPSEQQQRLNDLEKKLDDLRRDLEALRGKRAAQLLEGPGRPNEYVINARAFKIPFQVEAAANRHGRELVLYVSRDKGGTWRKAAAATPDRKEFTFQADEDGIYWFAVVIHDHQAEGSRIEDDQLRPELKVVVDTKTGTDGR